MTGSIGGIRLHGVEIRPIMKPNQLVDTGFRIARILTEDHRTMEAHIGALMGEFHEAHSCRIYLMQKEKGSVSGEYRLEQRLSVEKIADNGNVIASDAWPRAPEEDGLMNKAFLERKPIIVDHENGRLTVFDNLDMNDQGCDVYALGDSYEGGRNHLAIMPLYYRVKESPFGVAVFEGVDCSEANLVDFERTFWTTKMTMAAASQISYALVHRFDPITGLTSQSDFNVDLRTCARDLLHGSLGDLKLMLIDLDGFKLVNDTFSYRTGNRMLREVAKRIQSKVREEDLVYKWGGDEFAIILPEISMSDACGIAKRINRSIAQAVVKTDKGDATVSCSIGIVDMWRVLNKVLKNEVYDGEEEARYLERIAKLSFDKANYMLKAAKKDGKNSVFYYEGRKRKKVECNEPPITI